ncbi:Uncharacterised protein [Streptococcus pneumoniae]|jgi:hypothetical protein|nr:MULTISPECIES: DUF6685 family protein [Gammaproteobacteria]EPL61483.1 hypothetical protein B382_15403 [Stutzerimonas stutzeri B1SMN1]MBU2014854.1 hypothetical protein [Gammaproteobacteria bacterium]MCB4797128.1 hypothetical protein [Pseudomonas sp. NP21570]MDH2244427.1 hypothetical protein [Pseudomonas sp. GD03909]WAD26112.1 hypothetical protein OS670_17125 [Pseudomonadaceae bacterium T75]CJL91587.1 Uncharacterised protein [Streptococcus pneumoniae]
MKLIKSPVKLNSPIQETAKGIGAGAVVRWHDFGSLIYERGIYRDKLNGWTHCRTYGRYGSTSIECAPLLRVGSEMQIQRWRCDIQQVDGFSASKSELKEFATMDDMVVRNSPEMIDEISPAKLAKNLAWDEIRIISHVDHDYFATWAWDGRVFLMNSGGSHHFAAAKYIAARLEQPVELTGTYKIYGLCEQAITELRREYGMFVLSHEPDAWLGFNEAMARFKATYYWKTLPRPHNHQRCAIFLPLKEKRSAMVARILKENNFQDLGAYLAGLAAQSQAVINKVNPP